MAAGASTPSRPTRVHIRHKIYPSKSEVRPWLEAAQSGVDSAGKERGTALSFLREGRLRAWVRHSPYPPCGGRLEHNSVEAGRPGGGCCFLRTALPLCATRLNIAVLYHEATWGGSGPASSGLREGRRGVSPAPLSHTFVCVVSLIRAWLARSGPPGGLACLVVLLKKVAHLQDTIAMLSVQAPQGLKIRRRSFPL